MNEQAIIDSYNLFVQSGYKKSLQEFKQLLASNPEAVNDSYGLFQQNGYRKSIDEYKTLMGIGAAVESPMAIQPVVEEPKKKEDTASPFVAGGSEPTKSDGLGALAVQVQDESILTKKPRQERPVVSGESTKVVRPKDAEFGYQKQKAIETPLPQFVEEQLSTITPSLIGKIEENVVPQLKYQFAPLGFNFKESSAGDFMIATSPSGESIEISLDITDAEDRKAEADKLNAFLRKGAGAVKNLSTLQSQYTEANKKILSQKELDESLASINAEEANIMARNAEFVKTQNNLEAEKARLESVPPQQRNNPEYIARVNDFISRADQFSNEFQTFIKDAEDLTKRGQQLNKSIGKYTEMKAQQGTWYGAAFNAVANKSIYDMAKGMAGLTIDFLGEVIPATGLPIMSQEDYEKNFIEQARKEGVDITEGEDFISLTSRLDAETIARIENRVIDVGKKNVKGEVIGYLDKASKQAMEASGVSPEYYRSIEETFVGGALLGALSSIPAMAGGPVARTVLMSSQVMAGLDAEMANDPAFADVSENEKLLVKAPIAVAVGILENLGLSNLLKQKGFLNGLVLKALGKVGTGASYKTFGEVIKNEIDSAVGRGALTLGAGFLAEAETGALQEITNIGAKELYNMVKEKEMFDTPDSVIQFVEQVGKASLQEGIGAGVLAVPGSVSAAYRGKGFLGMDDAQFAMFEKMANDSNIEKGFVARLKSRINAGEITTAEGKDILNNYRNSVSLFNSLPENLDIQGKKEAMNLLKERRDLERQIDGKDQSLTAPQRNRITQINEQLTKLSEDAIQKQAAGQVPVQPGTGVSQEVAQGEPQAEPQGVTQEGQVQEEVAPTQEVDFTEEEVSELEKAISKNLPEYFQLATKKESPEKMAVLTDAATKLMDQVQPEIVKESEVVEQPSIDTIPITVTENVELANKVPKMSVNDLVGKKVNYVMADQLKVDDELMGGPFFPLMDDTFGKVAWASMDEDAAKNIIRGFIKGDYSVVYNMSPSAIDSNIATLNEFVKRLNSIPASENIYPQISEYLKGRKFGKDTKAIQDLVDKSSNLESFIDGFKSLNVDQKQAIIKAVLPSKSVNATTKLGSTLQNNNITQESVREAISEQFARDLPMGAMTMVLEITDAEGNPIKSEADIDKAIMTRDQQVAEGIRPHKNYPVYIRGRAVAMLSDTVPVWNVSSRALDTMNKKAAGILQKKVPQPEGAVEGTQETRRFSAAEIRADEMYTLQRSATRAEEVLVPMNTQYQIFVEKLSRAIPSVEIVTSQVEFDNLMNDLNAKKLATKNQKIYGAVLNGKLYLNPGLENFNTPIHEFGHVWMNTVKELSPEIYNKGIDLIKNSEYVSQVDENPEYNRVTKKMKEDGMTDEQIRQYVLEEALATAIGDKGESFVNASQKRNFKNWLNELFQFIKKLTGISKLTPEQIQDLSLDDFLNSVVVDLLSEKPIFKNAEVRNLNNQLQLMARPDLKADDIVKIGLANGFSEGSIRELLKRRGFTQEEINRAVASTVQAAKKVEVTEEFAPGYNRVLNEIFGKDGVVARSRRRGRSEEETMQNAIDYLEQDTKVYENATDVQREAMVRNVRKEFKKREKAAPSAKKVLGQKKDVVTVTVDLAKERDRIIREQIKLAKEVTGDLNQKRAALADAIRLFEDGGVITTAQTKTIVNRISKVNLNNPIMVDRLLAYIEKVFDNANYAADMAELRKLQKQAKSRNHTSMTNVVKQFTSINPENIPLDRIQDYKEALDFLNNRTPFYGNMNDIFDEMLSYQISEEFDAIKTMEALEKKYEDIMSNQVKNVEDYVNLIKDINSFKRKAFQLLQNEEITQKNYDDLINMVGKDQQTIEENYKDEITKIKKDLIAEIKNQRPKVSRDFSNVENDLIRKYLELSDADLESLSPEDLFVLNDLLDNISNGEIDNFRFNEIISKAYTSDGANRLAKQIDDSKFDMTPEEGTKELSEYESSFWEGLLGMGRAKSGALQKFVVSVFNRAIASYENLTRDGYNKFLKIKDEYKMSDKDMHKIGMLTTYLQEYMAQFDPKNEGIKDIGKRDWFKEILNSKSMRGKYSSGKPSILKVVGLGKSEIDIIEEIWDSLPKDKEGNVDPKAVYDSYMANDGKFFTKNQKGFFDDVMAYKTSEITPKQKFANEINGASFKEIPFHMMRVRLDGGRTQINPTASSDNGVVRIKAGTGKERVSEAVGPIMTNFEKLFITNLEQTGRDYFLSGALKDINNTLSGAKKKIDPDKMPILDTISGTLSEALGYEFDRTQSNFIFRNLLSARAAMTLLRPIRTVTELGSTLLSYPVRAKTLSGYKSLFGEQGAMKKLLEFTNSPMLLRDNINKAIDINDGRIEPQSRFTKATNYLSGLPERTMMITSWMPTFKSEFKNSTGIDFDINKFNTSEVYREKYGKAIREASAAADAQTEKIIGPTVKAGQRREVRIAPKVLANIIGLEGTVPKNSAAGQILGFFSNYPYREVTEFINGFKEAAEVIKDEGALSSLSQLQKPLGIALNVAAYGFLGTLTYAGQLILLGDEDDEERGIKLLKDIMTTEGLLNELASNAISLAGSKYAAGGKALLQLAATIAIESTDDEEQKAKIKKLLKDSVFVDPLPVEQAAKFGGRDKALSAIAMYIPQFVIFADRYADFIGGINEFEAIYDKVESKGVESLTQDEGTKILALNTIINASQILLNVFGGTSLPEYNNIKTYMKKLKEEAGVADVYKGESLAKKKSSGGGGGGRAKTMNKSDLKKYFPEQYNELYGEGSATYEIEQEVKAFEKEQREMKKRIKDQVYGGKD